MAGFIQNFLLQYCLPDSYESHARRYFDPVAEALAAQQTQMSRPLFIGLNGCQGSGKTTLASYLLAWFSAHNLNAISISLDDFYYGKSQRSALARTVHPLLATRGVPGTHDTELARTVLSKLANGETGIRIPAFNKAQDDRVPESEWRVTQQAMDVVLIEGWCWGATPQHEDELKTPVNAMEANDDEAGIWRRYVNECLATQYPVLHQFMDVWLMLKAPSFDCVYQWRLEQEQKLVGALSEAEAKKASGVMSPDQISRFIQYYQRLTEHLLVHLPNSSDVVWALDSNRGIESMVFSEAFSSLIKDGVS
ncbi:hypothetical protein [Litoribacillus peritrichatus]|uniref:Kinase n=1 Tax=Litoribacillus peritrichatus TaxID=718191 RepID=A0ABP7N759_9GAMM